MQRALMIGGFSVLSLVALGGWLRTPPVGAQGIQPPAQGYYAYVTPVQPAPMPTAYSDAQAPAYAQPAYQESAYQPVVSRRATTVQRVQVRRKRPLKHSVAIVAGSAGTGAAIGALAGGGRGAAIGALAGGAGGFIFDQITRNR